MNPLWKLYKSKVLKSLNSEYEEDTAEEVHNWSFAFYLCPAALLWSGLCLWSQRSAGFTCWSFWLIAGQISVLSKENWSQFESGFPLSTLNKWPNELPTNFAPVALMMVCIVTDKKEVVEMFTWGNQPVSGYRPGRCLSGCQWFSETS